MMPIRIGQGSARCLGFTDLALLCESDYATFPVICV